MTEYPGYRPWHVAGDPWYTHAELEALLDTAMRRADQRGKDARKNARARHAARRRR